ncbi:hypothetical protein D1823_07330 [Ruegeria sp. AD91A]|nr:hypothetical protein D1823_07330 [Ruegeria sp. AD91A]
MMMSLTKVAPYFDIHVMSSDGWPVHCNLTVPNKLAIEAFANFPKAALPEAGRAASGRGMTRAQAEASGLGEAIEIASLCRWGDELTLETDREDCPEPSWDAQTLMGFSNAQRRDRRAWNDRLRGIDWIPDPKPVGPAEWVEARSIDGGSVWVPSQAVFMSHDLTVGSVADCVADTNGCAAGSTDRAAQTHALLELIERDAAGRWWYGARARRLIGPDMLDEATTHTCTVLQNDGFAVKLIDITTDLGAPVVVAAGAHAGGKPIALGFGAAVTLVDAAQKAACEMAQMLLVFQDPQGDSHRRPHLNAWMEEASLETAPLGAARFADGAEYSTSGSFLSRIRAAGVRLAFLEQTRPEFGVPVWRAISPDLCHWKPRFGRQRLLGLDPHDIGDCLQTPNPVLLPL